VAKGTIGRVAVHEEIRNTATQENQVAVKVSGTLGDKPVASTVTSTQTADSLTVVGQGNIAGTAFSVTTTVPVPHR
jgi:hypothetical protein